MSSARDQIIQTTCTLLELQGYHATGLNQIIKESGSPKGSLYYYFPDGKEGLIEEAIRHVGRIVHQRMETLLAVESAPAEAIASFLENIAFNVEQSGFQSGGPITTVALESAATSPRLREVCEQIYNGWKQIVTQTLIRNGIAPARAARLGEMTIAAIEGGIILCRTRRSQQPLLDIAQELRLLIGMG
jgi:TetR/AcrR family transcriptional repressor of lmrAB and yxaGH operons